jgi:serine/threonine protein kinase
MFTKGDQIGPYILVDQLGHGSFGFVWRAERRGLTTTEFAIKLPLDAKVDIAEIKREAEVWAQAKNHPNVLPIIEADIYNGQIAIVSEYAQDGSVDGYVRLLLYETDEVISWPCASHALFSPKRK